MNFFSKKTQGNIRCQQRNQSPHAPQAGMYAGVECTRCKQVCQFLKQLNTNYHVLQNYTPQRSANICPQMKVPAVNS